MREDVRAMLGDFAKYAPPLVAQSLVPIVSIPILTHVVAPADYGTYSLVKMTADLGTVLVASGLGTAAVRYIPAYRQGGESRQLMASLLALLATGLTLGVVLFGLLGLYSGMSDNQMLRQIHDSGLLAGGVALFALGVLFSFMVSVLRANRRVLLYGSLQAGQGILTLVIGVPLLIVTHGQIAAWLWSGVVAYALLLGWRWARDVRLAGRLHLANIDKPLSRRLARFAFFIALGNAGLILLALSDRWIVGLFRDTTQVGLYSVSYDLATKTVMLGVAVFDLTAPALLAQTWEARGREATAQLQSAMVRFYLLAITPLAVGAGLFAGPILRLFTAPNYWDAAGIVPFVALSMLLYGLSEFYTRGFILCDRPDISTRDFFLAGGLNIALNLLLVPFFGYFVAGITTLIGYLALLLLQYRGLRAFVTWRFPWATALRVALACLIMAAAIWTLQATLAMASLGQVLLLTMLGAAVYGAVILITGELSLKPVAASLQAAHRYITRADRVEP